MLPVIIVEELLTFRNLLTAARVANAAKTIADLADDPKEQEKLTEEVQQNIDSDDEAYFFFLVRSTFAKVATYCNTGNPSIETLDAITTDALDSDLYVNAPSTPDVLVDAFIQAWINSARIQGTLNLDCLGKAVAGFRKSGIPSDTMTSWLTTNTPSFSRIAAKVSEHVDLPPALMTSALEKFGDAIKTGPANAVATTLSGKDIMLAELFIMRLYAALITDQGLTSSIGSRKLGRPIISTAFLPLNLSREAYSRPTFHERVVTRLDENDLVDRIRKEQGHAPKSKGLSRSSVDKQVLSIMEKIYGTKKANRKQKEGKGTKHKSGSGSKAEKFSAKGGTFKDAKGGDALSELANQLLADEKKSKKK